MNNKFRKIKNKLAFWFLLIALVPMVFTAIFTYIEQTSELKKESYAKLEAIRDLKVLQLTNWLAERSRDLLVIANDIKLTDLERVTGDDHNGALNPEIIVEAREILQYYKENFPDYNEILIMHPETGKVVISTEMDHEGADKSRNAYFTKPLKSRSLEIKDIYYSEEVNKYSMAFSVPVLCRQHNGEHLVGILAVRVNLDYSLYEVLQNRIGLGESGETLIVNKDQVALNKLRWYDNAQLLLHIDAEPARQAAIGNKGIIEAKDYRGEKVLAAYTHIPATGWGFVCKQDMREIKRPIHKLFMEFLLLIGLTSLVIVVSSFLISRTISEPLVSLKRMAAKIEQGDYSVRNNVVTHDEIGSLAKSVNVMAAAIESQVLVQKGVSLISGEMIGKSSQKEYAEGLLQILMEITDSVMGAFYVLNENIQMFEHKLSIGVNSDLRVSFDAQQPEGEFGTAISAGRIYHFKNIAKDSIFEYLTVAGSLKPREIITIPVLSSHKVVALISLAAIHNYTDECLDSLNMSWNAINLSYSNILHSEKTSMLAQSLSYSNTKLEAQKEELEAQALELKNQAEELQENATELREQNQELEVQKQQVLQSTRLKSEFLSNMSHELRTPLNSVLALSELLQQQTKEKLNSEEQKYLAIIERNGRRLLEQINDILDLSKIEAGKVDLIYSKVSVNTVLENICDLMKPLADQKETEIRLELFETQLEIETDEKRLYQILQNIIGNAVKFTETGYVHVSAGVEDHKVKIMIKDTGIGIAPENLAYIFEEFRQIDGSNSRNYEGTGLGLAISSKLVKLLGGYIEVDSELGMGTTFTVMIPVQGSGDIKEVFYKYEMPLELKEIDDSEETAATRLLVVEDNESVIIQMSNLLERKGYIVAIARNGREALEYVQHTIPDGIILDLMMPEIDGFEVLEKIRSTKVTQHLPVLILTAKDLDKNDMARLSENNVQQLVHKDDIDLKGLLYKINLMLHHQFESAITRSTQDSRFTTHKREKEIPDSAAKPRILVIEDNLDSMVTMQAIIPDKYTVIKALDGITGLQIAVTQIPDLILLDINLPRMSGIELLGMLKKAEETAHIPIIAVTGRAGDDDEEELLAAGCDDYLAKPIESVLLLRKITKWIK
ncbi:MAG: response regulator [Candidatus Cloacimonetes bacterium]|nr:response regulator [Candidatus Cloacimonadota bacterium]